MNATTQRAGVYALGHSEFELQRLTDQSRYVGDLTEQVLRNAGLAPGMRVLDLGCGTGDVSFLAASLVGPTGRVLGIDKVATAVEKAHQRAADAGFDNVSFEVADAADYRVKTPVDAIIGRLVLLYLLDPVAALRRLANQARPGTLFVFHEMDMSTVRSLPESALCRRGAHWILETFRRAGTQIDMGSKLHTTFRRAGMPGPQMLLGARIEGGPDAFAYEYMAQVLRSLLPMAERFGVTTAREVEIDTFAARLRDEVVAMDGVMQPPAFVGAWARVPG